MKRLLFVFILIFPMIVFGQDVTQNAVHEIPKHYSALPNLYNFNAVMKEQLSDKIIRQYVMGATSMLVKWTLKKDAVIALHLDRKSVV